jgi:hypothetical protein
MVSCPVHVANLLCFACPTDLEDELADLGPEAGAEGDGQDREERRRRYEEDDFGDEGR